MKVSLHREPGVTAALVDNEADQLAQLARLNRHIPESSRVDVGRSIFYMIAIGEYAEYIRNHPITPSMISARRDSKEDDLDRKSGDRTILPVDLSPPSPDKYVVEVDKERFNEALGIMVVEDVTLGKVFLNSAVHYFQSRPDQLGQ